MGILVPSLAFLDLSTEMRGILLGAAVACVVGAVDEIGALGVDDEGQRQQHGDGEHLGHHVLDQPHRREGHQHHADGGPQAGVGDGVELDALHALHARHGRRRPAA